MSIADERVQYEAALAEILAGLGGSSIGDIPPERMVLINYTKVKLDELIPQGEGVVFSLSSDANITNPTDLLVNSQMDECTKDICLSAPTSILTPTVHAGTVVPFGTGDKTGYIVLPGSFLRLSSFKMTDWKTDVAIPITTTDPKYKKQKYSVTRGGINKPVAVLNWKNVQVDGGLKTITLGSGGANYDPGVNTLRVVQTGGFNGTINVTANSEGVITAINSITTKGYGYTVANGLATVGGFGYSCTINITEVETVVANRRILEYYSVDTHDTLDKLLYIPEQTAEAFIALNPNLLDALAWQCASKVLQITGRTDLAKLAQERVAQSYFNIPA